MTIIIKEIHVKTEVEKSIAPSVSEKTIAQLKRNIINEIDENLKRTANWDKER